MMTDETVTAAELREAARVLRAANVATDNAPEDSWTARTLENVATDWDAENTKRAKDIDDLAGHFRVAMQNGYARAVERGLPYGDDSLYQGVASEVYSHGWRRP